MDGMIFDVDGTLWDSTEEVAKSWTLAIREKTDLNRVITREELKSQFGKPTPEIIRNLFPDLTEVERQQLSVHLFQYENEWVKHAACLLYEGMPGTIRALSEKFPLFIVSNCQAGYIEAFLENTGLSPYITDHLCPDDTGKLKGENIRIIMERNGISGAVYVGDTRGDAKACEEAGISMIYAAYGFGDADGMPAVIRTIDSFGELLSYM